MKLFSHYMPTTLADNLAYTQLFCIKVYMHHGLTYRNYANKTQDPI